MPSPDAHIGLAAVARLVRVAGALASGDEDQRWLASALGHYIKHAPADVDLDQALGLVVRPGEPPWWRAQQYAERDDLIRALAAEEPGRTHQRATALQQRLRRYAATAWPRDRIGTPPSVANRLLFEVFVIDPDPPTGVRRLTQILGR